MPEARLAAENDTASSLRLGVCISPASTTVWAVSTTEMDFHTVLEATGSKNKVSGDWVSPAAPLLALQMATFSLCLNRVFAHLSCLCTQISAYKVRSDEGPPERPPFKVPPLSRPWLQIQSHSKHRG